MRHLLAGLCVLFASMSSTVAQVSVGIAMPGVSIGINQPVYPPLVAVPGYPVYYAPGLNANYFFYDGMYWVYQGDDWYMSAWYNGPWTLVSPLYVPPYILRVPVRYYRVPPPYFRPWYVDAPPRWGEHWGNDWQRQRRGWDQWDRQRVPAPAPLPLYQRQYTGERYPQQLERQQALNEQNYRYRPKDPVVREQYRAQAPQGRPQARGPQPQDIDRPAPAPSQKPPQGPGPREQQQQPRPPSPADMSQAREPSPQSQPQPQPSAPQQKGPPQGKGNDNGRGQGGKPPQ